MHLLERGLHQLAQRRHGHAQHLAVMLGGHHRHVQQARGLRQLVRGRQHGLAVVDHGHQAALHVDDEQDGIGGLQQHGGSPETEELACVLASQKHRCATPCLLNDIETVRRTNSTHRQATEDVCPWSTGLHRASIELKPKGANQRSRFLCRIAFRHVENA